MPKGKIIAIVGAPRSGKSFLARKLAAHYNAKLFLENESEKSGGGDREYPDWLEESIAQDKWHLARQLWFRSRLVKTYLEAVAHKGEGHNVVLDTFWVSTSFYVETTLTGFERDLMRDVLNLDQKSLDLPDLVIFLKISEAGIRRFLADGGRWFDRSEEYLQNTILPVNALHEQFFSNSQLQTRVLTIPRDQLDFADQTDFQSVIKQIGSTLQK